MPEEYMNSSAISDYKLAPPAVSDVHLEGLPVIAFWTNAPAYAPEGWKLCEPPYPTGWHRYERKRS